jgi:hypothetical protein
MPTNWNHNLKKKVTLLMSQNFKVFLIAPTLNT